MNEWFLGRRCKSEIRWLRRSGIYKLGWNIDEQMHLTLQERLTPVFERALELGGLAGAEEWTMEHCAYLNIQQRSRPISKEKGRPHQQSLRGFRGT